MFDADKWGRKCKQCGDSKPLSQFRRYYGGRKGWYTTCLACERINSRYKYLLKKKEPSAAELEEFGKIQALYDKQRDAGLRPPTLKVPKSTIVNEVDELLGRYDDAPEGFKGVPRELQEWLTAPLTEEPEYYTDDVYEKLSEKYRPAKRVDKSSLTVVYDDTYKEVLHKILDRFYAYEDACYNK